MECPHIPTISYNEFGNRIHKKMIGQRIPITGSIEVTARCNLSCAHCYINLPAGERSALERELTSDEFKNILDQLVDEGCLWLLLTGGEPFIRSDFLEIYTYTIKKGLLITLFTNGTMITPQIADYLAEWPPINLEITLYGCTQDTYEQITGTPGSFKRCIEGIELLIERNIPLRLKTMVMEPNKHELSGMKDYAAKLGVEFRYDSVLNMRLDGGKKPSTFRIPAQEVVELDLADEKRLDEWRKFCDKFCGVIPEDDFIYQCGAGNHTCNIDSFGHLSVCGTSRNPSYDLRQGSFQEGWHEFMPKVLGQRWSKETPCMKCGLISLCGQCPGWAELEHGDPEQQVEYLCEIAHMRADAFGLEN
ncbi:MAG: radical SAM protein [Deltaproteobacteria bacterium]|nr:radical SAM protein [Deltaproteobacteria bacterium]